MPAYLDDGTNVVTDVIVVWDGEMYGLVSSLANELAASTVIVKPVKPCHYC